MITYTGTRIEPPSKFDGAYDAAPDILSIAVALGRMPRWAGAGRVWFSVLHHLLLVARLMRLHKHSDRMILLGMLHDAHEAVTGDVPAFWKPVSLKVWQRHLDTRIYDFLGIDPPTEDEEETIAEYDELSLRLEAEIVGPVSALVHIAPADPKLLDERYIVHGIRNTWPAPNDSADGPSSPLVLAFLKEFATVIRSGSASPVDQTPQSQT